MLRAARGILPEACDRNHEAPGMNHLHMEALGFMMRAAGIMPQNAKFMFHAI